MATSLPFLFFFFNDTATTEIYTLSLHDALPILAHDRRVDVQPPGIGQPLGGQDRKSTRLNSSHPSISYAVFCLKKKNPPPTAVELMFCTDRPLRRSTTRRSS